MRELFFTGAPRPRFIFAQFLVIGGLLLPVHGEGGCDGEPLGSEERAEIDLMRRRGEGREALEILDEVLAETPDDGATLFLRARGRFERCDFEGALTDARRAHRLLTESDRAAVDLALLAESERELARILLALGRAAEAVALFESRPAAHTGTDPRDAWLLGSALLEVGNREGAEELFARGAEQGLPDWRAQLARARCQRVLGRIEDAARSLIAADRLAAAGEGAEPDVLCELASVYFEAYGEVDDPLSRTHSPEELYREALTLHGEHEGALLGLFELHRFNWLLHRERPAQFLAALFEARPDSIAGLVVRCSAALDDGDLPTVRRALARLEELAGGRREVIAQRAALAWIEHRQEDARALLDGLLASDPRDSVPERELGRHLLELYRFAEAKPFLESAVERDGSDWHAWRELGRAQANTGDAEAARVSLAKAKEMAHGRRDAWRDNTALVLGRMAGTMVEEDAEELSFAWLPDASFVLRTYYEPFYREARESLSARYGYTPAPARIEVFRKWGDFSVRSTGFEGFPALGVCFGPVVTAVSPLSELRGQFSWARTSYHEFTHVIHLGLSHNRCPRWITEGLATWEEAARNPAWGRNLRRELIDARANGEIIPIREMNAAFRGPRVIFAYYLSGLVCKMLIEEHGFAPMVRLLEAFDGGADVDGAFAEQFGCTPEELDVRLAEYIDREVASLAIEPRWSSEHTFRLRFRLSRQPAEGEAERVRWARDWCTVAWGAYWDGRPVDAEEALRIAEGGGPLPPRGLFLRAEICLGGGDKEGALELYEIAFAAGGEDFRARMAYGALLREAGEWEGAEREFLAAERVFPGFANSGLSAEIELATLYEEMGRTAEAMEARIRWLAWNAGECEFRMLVASWLAEEGRFEESDRFWRESNEVDPFRRFLHHGWGRTLRELGRHEEALREFEVALRMPRELDRDVDTTVAHPGAKAISEEVTARWLALESELWGLKALSLQALGREEEAVAAAEEARALDPDCEAAREVLDR
jgi:cellulose synthase operon protein C